MQRGCGRPPSCGYLARVLLRGRSLRGLQLGLCALMFASAASVLPATAQSNAAAMPAVAPPASLEGDWIGSPLTEKWTIGTWGQACGPTPQAQGAAGGSARVTRSGSELSISGGGRTFSTATCWENYPGLSRVSHSAPAAEALANAVGTSTWSSVCRTAASDPRKATVRTNVSATLERIVLSESGSYEFLLEGSACNASVTRQRVFTRPRMTEVAAAIAQPTSQLTGAAPIQSGEVTIQSVQPSAKPAPVAGPGAMAPPDSTAAASPPASECTSVGRLERLRIEPSITWARPGTNLEVHVDARDAHGCVIAKPRLGWTFEPAGSLAFRGPKRLRIAANAPEGTLKIIARQGAVSAEASIELVSEARFQAFLAVPQVASNVLPAAPAATDVSAGPHQTVATAELVASDEGERRKWLFAAIALLICGVLAGLGLMLVRQSRVKRRSPSAALPPHHAATEGVSKVCPSCGAEYGSGFQFCGRDGSVLVLRG